MSRICFTLASLLPIFASGTLIAQEQLAVIRDPQINESSGMAISRRYDDAIWIHNDSGDRPRLFLVGLDGITRGIVNLANAKAVDWEDMCSFEFEGEPWLLIADVGDNQQRRTRRQSPCRLYLLREPVIPEGDGESTCRCDVAITLDYADGPHNCESVAVDPTSGVILLMTKESPLSTAVYQIPLDLTKPQQIRTAEQIVRLPLPFATAMDISPDGRQLVAVTMWGGWICQREKSQSWDKALTTAVHRFPLPPRRQGETVCFTADGQSLILNSEHRDQPLWRVAVDSLQLPANDAPR